MKSPCMANFPDETRAYRDTGGYRRMSWSVGMATGWVDGQLPRFANAMCDLWFALSSDFPFQQLRKLTCSVRTSSSSHCGTIAVFGLPPTPAHVQETTSLGCRFLALDLPETSFRPAGNAVTSACVRFV